VRTASKIHPLASLHPLASTLIVSLIVSGALFAAIAAFAPATAGSESLTVEGTGVGLGVDLSGDGVDADASVGDVDAGVGLEAGDDGVNAGIDLGIGDTEVSLGAGVGGGAESGGGGGGSGSGSNGNAGTPGDNGSNPADDGDDTSRQPGSPDGGEIASGESSAQGRDGDTQGEAGSGEEASGRPGGDAAGSNGDSGTAGERPSVLARVLAYVPGWVWVALATMLIVSLAVFAYGWYERRRRRAAERLAAADPLTGVANLSAFGKRLDEELSRARRYRRPLGLMMIDLDGFKQVNDEHGHDTGNDVLTNLAIELGSRLRSSDLVARVGGDEFAVICPETALRGLVGLRESLEEELPQAIGHDVGVSIGIAELRASDSGPDDVVARADRSMYRRKRAHKAASSDGEVEAGMAKAERPPIPTAAA
jgi:diguanylate cyclase (GGDEF)-like protein